MKQTHRCWAEIDRSALRHNARIVRDRVGSAEILAVVKANAYGHGLFGVAETLADEAQLFGVANLEEALALRESFSHPIVILGPALPGERSTIAERGFHSHHFCARGSRGFQSGSAPLARKRQFQD